MCRLFGFKSRLLSQVHKSLIAADNALMNQSSRHPDGWGVAYYVDRCPHLIRSVASAINDELFQRVSGVVSAQTVLAHLRKATIGDLNPLNTHPFQHGRWTFGHNGNIKDFDTHREALLKLISKELRPYLLGTTDSEIIFFILLSHLIKDSLYDSESIETNHLAICAKRAIQAIVDICGECHPKDSGPPTETFLSFILTNGDSMLGFHGGKDLHFSTHKLRCSDRAFCKHFSQSCEHKVEKGPVNHLIFASEELAGENVWAPIPFMEMVGIDRSLNLWKSF